ncbi:Gfo/Idh/MocA family oxidoreductase [Sulfitobacter sp. LCG007]
MVRTRIALVGLGMAVAPHAAALRDLSETVEVVNAYAPTAARREEFARRHGFPVCDSLETILTDDSIDAVGVLTPPDTHGDIGRACARAGKHVLLEKPLDITTARAQALAEDMQAAGIRTGVVLQHRFRPAAVRAAELLAGGTLGRILGCSATIRLWRPQSYYDAPGRGTYARDGGGVLMTQAIHTLDLMLSLAGPVREVSGFVTTTPLHRMEAEDMVSAALRFENGAFGTVEATTAAFPGFPEEIVLTCEGGVLMLKGTQMLMRRQDGGVEDIAPDEGPGGTGSDPMAFSHACHLAVWSDFADAIGQGRDPMVTASEALKVHRLIDALTESGRSGTTVRVMQ